MGAFSGRRIALRAAALALAMLLTACASIPLSTMLRMSRLDEAALLSLDPAEVRVQVAITEGFEIAVDEATLELELIGAGGEVRTTRLALDLLLQASGTRGGGLLRPPVPVTVYDLTLAQHAVQELRGTQHWARAADLTGLALRVQARVSGAPRGADHVRLWTGVRLRPAEEYMTLFEGARFELEPAPAEEPSST